MLAVTAVNGCRYCSYFHTKQALKSGITAEEIRDLLAGDVANCPQDEAVAAYGHQKTEAIHLILRMIRMANLLGNSWDYLIYRISFGRKGG